MSKKKMIIIAIALVVAVAALLALYFLTRPPKPEETTEKTERKPAGISVTIQVVHSSGETVEFSYSTTETSLGALLRKEGLAEGHEDGGSFFVDAVDGEAAVWEVDSSYWQVFDGETAAIVGVDDIALIDGGVYKLVYTIYG